MMGDRSSASTTTRKSVLISEAIDIVEHKLFEQLSQQMRNAERIIYLFI